MKPGLVIVGGGQAGFSAARKARGLDPDIPIVLMCGDPNLPYQLPPLSKAYLSGEMGMDRLRFAEQSWYDEQNITTMTGVRVQSIDRAGKSVSTNDGQTIRYEKLLLATGSTPRLLPESVGGSLKGVHVLRTAAHSDGMRPNLEAGKRLVIIGGGYIGLEVAAVANKLGMSVTLLEMADRILQRVAAPQTSDFFRDLHTSHGVDIRESTGLKEIVGSNGAVSGVLLEDGTQIETDFVLVGIGVVPNDDLARAAGLDVENGILVSDTCQTSDPAIYAAGDCCCFDFGGVRTRLESVPNAFNQADIAAENMVTNGNKAYVPMPWFWSDQYDVKLQIAGLNRDYDETIIRPGKNEGSQSVWYYRNDRLIAVDAMNDAPSFAVARRVIDAGKSIPKDAAMDPSVNLKVYLKG